MTAIIEIPKADITKFRQPEHRYFRHYNLSLQSDRCVSEHAKCRWQLARSRIHENRLSGP